MPVREGYDCRSCFSRSLWYLVRLGLGAEESEAVMDDHGLMGAAVKAKAKIKATIVKGIPNISLSARQETEPI